MNGNRPAHIPGATCRLQLHRSFTLADAGATLPYLSELGITDVYLSPPFSSRPGSTHGYDVCRFDRVNPELGGRRAFEAFAAALRRRQLGLLADMVPNHMAASTANPWWHNVLRRGRRSPFATWFDVDWNRPGLAGRILLPILEDHYAAVLKAGKLRVVRHQDDFQIAYYGLRLPLSPESSSWLRRQLAGTTLDLWLAGPPDTARAVNRLDALLRRQSYRLAFWKTGPEEINYRRFFDVNDLVCLRAERPEVFAATHRLLFQWFRRGILTGIRADHPDGLWDPKQYCLRLQQPAGIRSRARRAARRLYVVVEKILATGESLPPDWPVDGTTGYDFLNQVNGLFVDAANEIAFDRLYREFTGCLEDFQTVAYRSKVQVLDTLLISELRSLSGALRDLARRTLEGRDLTPRTLTAALKAVIAAFPVYRTYLDSSTAVPEAADAAAIDQAITAARRRNPRMDPAAFEFIRHLLRLSPAGGDARSVPAGARNFVLRFQQLTGPVMAKGVEDTAFYRYCRLVSLNEVGGDPATFGFDPAAFHAANQRRARHWPHALLATATHDTKRGEDVRARINVLSEMPRQWRGAIGEWRRFNARWKGQADRQPAPDANDEYLLYQTLVGAWPDSGRAATAQFRERIAAYLLKAVKEAKRRTSWIEPNTQYEDATVAFVRRVLAPRSNRRFLQSFRNVQRKVAFFGRVNSLAQTLFKLASPGVPDVYQGTELWDLSLVDPDNRRPVDYALRRRLLGRLRACVDPLPPEWLQRDPHGAVKMWVIRRVLQFRRTHRDLFECGEYIPLFASGAKAGHVCAFGRVYQGRAAVAVVPRLVWGLMAGRETYPVGRRVWQSTVLPLPASIPARTFRDVLTGETVLAADSGSAAGIEISRILRQFPVALLAGFDEPH